MIKRDIFSEVVEGFDALKEARAGKLKLKTTDVEYKAPSEMPATPNCSMKSPPSDTT